LWVRWWTFWFLRHGVSYDAGNQRHFRDSFRPNADTSPKKSKDGAQDDIHIWNDSDK
jgi:hypothetical protein